MMDYDDDEDDEQQMEAQALEAIFDDRFRVLESDPARCRKWCVELFPDLTGEDENSNHVACKLLVELPPAGEYPETTLPKFEIELVKGLAVEHVDVLRQLALEEAEANLGVPCVYAVSNRIIEWLAENNKKGLDDRSVLKGN